MDACIWMAEMMARCVSVYDVADEVMSGARFRYTGRRQAGRCFESAEWPTYVYRRLEHSQEKKGKKKKKNPYEVLIFGLQHSVQNVQYPTGEKKVHSRIQ
jgi:hypothetical protein